MTLKEARKTKGYTLAQLAQICDTNKSQLSRIENGLRNPSPELVKKLKTVLDDFDVAEKVRFTRADMFESVGEIYGYISSKIPKITAPTELVYAVEHPTIALLELAKKAMPMCILSEQENIWIAEVMSTIDRSDYTNDKMASSAEQTAFLLGYYRGIKHFISEKQSKNK